MKHSERVRLRQQAERLDLQRKCFRNSVRMEKQRQEDVVVQQLARKPMSFSHSNVLVFAIAKKVPKLVKDQHSLAAVEHMTRLAESRVSVLPVQVFP